MRTESVVFQRKLEVPGKALHGSADQKMSIFFVFMPLAEALKTNNAVKNKKMS